jgi:hypothetical protein
MRVSSLASMGRVIAALMLPVAVGCSDGGSKPSNTDANPNLAKFGFFVISVESVRELSGSADGFGGDLRFGETGEGAGLRGADKICAKAAEIGMTGAGAKTWRAFLSSSTGASGGGPVHAKDRVGTGPWYDALGRRVASDLTQLLMDRPGDADPAIRNDLPNEFGTPNHMDGAPGCTGSACPDNHQVLTGTAADGTLYTVGTPVTDATCNDWTSSEESGRPRSGHSWPRSGSGTNWMSSYDGSGCGRCVLAVGTAADKCVGSTGGYGGFYCFALASGG